MSRAGARDGRTGAWASTPPTTWRLSRGQTWGWGLGGNPHQTLSSRVCGMLNIIVTMISLAVIKNCKSKSENVNK